MKTETSRNLRLGIFVIAGSVFLIWVLYMIGLKRSMFGSTFKISAPFYNVNGLMVGHNVRFAGIDVGTVANVDIVSDTSVNVTMLIEDNVKKFIKKNAVASIGTDGLMGNKLVNINSVFNEQTQNVEDGDTIKTLKAIETDEMVRTLNTTNENIKDITTDLKTIAHKINSRNTLWSLLQDTVVADNVKQTIVSIKLAGTKMAIISGDFQEISHNIKSGKGLMGALLTDTTLSGKLEHTIVKLSLAGDKLAVVTGDLGTLTGKINRGEGTLGMLVMDTTFVRDLKNAMKNVDGGAAGFKDNMEALKHNVFLRKYFKKQAKAAAKKK
jgi:phospholipid/cholesterol/gamma-HCH transport system substrate-binding protein